MSSIRVKRGQQGDIDGGPGMQLMKDLAKEILQYVHLDDFGDGINPHIVIAAAMIEVRGRAVHDSCAQGHRFLSASTPGLSHGSCTVLSDCRHDAECSPHRP